MSQRAPDNKAIFIMRILIFGTTYADTTETVELNELWVDLHERLNPACDLLLVNSRSPMFPLHQPHRKELFSYREIDRDDAPELTGKYSILSFRDNIGHLSRNGRDGWGRAFCKGLEAAILNKYDYVAHIESDLLCRVDIPAAIDGMVHYNIPALSTIAPYYSFLETGLMIFNVNYLREKAFIRSYDWPGRTNDPKPEFVIESILGDDVLYKNWYGCRNDFDDITPAHLLDGLVLDYITHCKDMNVYRLFVMASMMRGGGQRRQMPRLIGHKTR